MNIERQPVVAGVVAKARHEQAQTLAAVFALWLRDQGYPYVVDSDLAQARPEIVTTPQAVVHRKQIAAHCSILVVFGGDGTLISAAHHPVPRPPVIVGVNAGTLGFLNEIDPGEVREVFAQAVAGTAPVEPRQLLCATIRRHDGSELHYYGVNDVVIGKEALARMLVVEVEINGERAARIRGDGVIVATPTGSTAYSLAAGGAIVHPAVKALLVTPISPHSLTVRPLVVPADAQVLLRVGANARQDIDHVHFTVDGQEGTSLVTGDEVRVNTSPACVHLVRSPRMHYFQILSTKLNWADGGRSGDAGGA